VPGRKTDVRDGQWLQELHTYGLLRGAFRPEDEVCVLRSSLRQRSMFVAMTQQAARCDRVRRLAEQGVQLVSGSDAGVSFNTFTDYPGDLIFTVEGTGLSPVYVLKSATSVAAEALGRRDLGGIAPGKAADVLAVQGNPLHDIRALTAPRLVVSRGRVVASIPGIDTAM